MTDQICRQANTRSANTVNLNFPYNGEQHATLIIRKHPKHGKDVIFRLERGQIMAGEIRDQKIDVRFDGGSAIGFSTTESANGSHNIAFIKDYDGFISLLMKSKKIRVSIPLYQEGNQVFDFDVSDFESKDFLSK